MRSWKPACRGIVVLSLLFIVFAGTSAWAKTPRIIHIATNAGEILNSAITPAQRTDVPIAATAFSLTYGPGLGSNQQAKDAFDRAAARWSAVLNDAVTINIDVDMASLGAGILGQAMSAMMAGGYNTVRDLVAAGGEAAPSWGYAREAALLPNLPTGAQFSAYLPDGFSMDGIAWLSKANYLALGGSEPGSDGAITLSSDFAWDYDTSDGIDGDKYDIEGIAVHEIGHILGFTSEVDYVDMVLSDGGTADDVWPRPLDLFRFWTPDLDDPGFDFTLTPRDLTPGFPHSFYYGDGSAPMSTGAFAGDGYQASHWKDDLGLGIMDPTAAMGELLEISVNDLIALDLIGWDAVPEPTGLCLLAIGALGLLRRRRAQVLRRRRF